MHIINTPEFFSKEARTLLDHFSPHWQDIHHLFSIPQASVSLSSLCQLAVYINSLSRCMVLCPYSWDWGQPQHLDMETPRQPSSSVLSHVQLFVTPWTVTRQVPLSMEFSRQEYWGGLPFPPPGDLPNPGTEPRSSKLRADSLPLSHQSAAQDILIHGKFFCSR